MRSALLLLLCASAAFAGTQEEIAARAGLEQKLGSQIPLDASFRDEHGQRVPLRRFFAGDKPVILALAYYKCPSLCTIVLNGLLQTAQNLKLDAGRDYQIVVVSFDARETPALAAAKKQIYLDAYGRPGAEEGWHFLCGEEEPIARLAGSVGYDFVYDETTRQFAHPSVIMVLTPEGRVARYFPGIEYPPREVRLALVEAGGNRIGSLSDRIFLLCYHYNPATGKYGFLIHRAMQIAGLGSAGALACYIALHLRKERRSIT